MKFEPDKLQDFRIVNKYGNISVILRLQNSVDKSFVFIKNHVLTFSVVEDALGKFVFKYKGIIVQELDLNAGGASDDLKFSNTSYNKFNTVKYTPSYWSGSQTVLDFDGRGGQYLPTFYDSDGVSHQGSAAFNFTADLHNLSLTLTHFG